MTPRRSTGRHVRAHAGRIFLAGLAMLAGGCTGTPAAKPILHRVVIQGFVFEPARLAVAAGDTVEWLNRDIVPHTATAAGGTWGSDSLPPGASWRTVLLTPGTEAYGCRLHPAMKAQIDVK